MSKKLFVGVTSFALATGILVSGFNASADSGQQSEVFNQDGESVITSSTASDSSAEFSIAASWGEGTLVSDDPLFGKPWGYAKTSTYAGTAYYLSAKITSDNDGLGASSDSKSENNAASIQSDTITSKTESTRFDSSHSIKDTSSSGYQYAYNTKSY